jgi:hypothetical protein
LASSSWRSGTRPWPCDAATSISGFARSAERRAGARRQILDVGNIPIAGFIERVAD